MDPVRNPFSPGAGTPPPELAGRDELRDSVGIAMRRVLARRPTKSVLMIGLRGVGKTVLLENLRMEAEEAGLQTIRIESPEGRSLPAMLTPQLRQGLIRLSRIEAAKSLANKGLAVLAGFATALKMKYQDITVGMDFSPERGTADNGDLEADLPVLLEVVGEAASKGKTALAMFIDELQYVDEEQLAAFITALHRAAQRNLPVVLVGAGLPQLRGKMGKAKSYAERLFEFPEIGALPLQAALDAVQKPARQEGVEFESRALDRLVEVTQGYPYFLQEWGKHVWDTAERSPITERDVEIASASAIAALDESFFRVRFDRLTPAEKRYLRAMSELGAGPHRSGDIASVLDREVTSLGPARSSLINKGMIWSPNHGDTAFTVPMFDEFMRRIMPGKAWRD